MSSLSYKNRQFLLDGSPFHILSGAIHYFRIVPEYWKDRLEKAKACGLNTIETYVPWNSHEQQQGVFKADGILDLRKFIKLAADLGFKVILRPGPYICSEWDFGGLPSWLLADPNMKVRSNYQGYKDAAEKYLKWVLGLVVDMQHSKGGPIIAVQVENEFGSYSSDVTHLEFIKDVIEKAGITELLITSDNPWGANPALNIRGVVSTANFKTIEEGKTVFDIIEKSDSEIPLMVMEFWSGWFDHWGSQHHESGVDILEKSLQFILDKNASLNFYMFHGGTNFGFMAGANQTDTYKPDVTSYDYIAPLSEDGKLTDKYSKIHDMIAKYLSQSGDKHHQQTLPVADVKTLGSSTPTMVMRREIKLEEFLPWSAMINHVTKMTSYLYCRTMEMFTFSNGETQSHGYIVYRKTINLPASSELVLPPYVKDRALILIDGKIIETFDWKSDKMSTILHANTAEPNTNTSCVLDIVVENLGRVNYTDKAKPDVLNTQRKGMEGQVTLGGSPINDWTIIALDFNDRFVSNVRKSNSWKDYDIGESTNNNAGRLQPDNGGNHMAVTFSPSMYRSKFDITGKPADSFVKLDGFTKGIVLINGFNLGRYWNIGPQRTLYLPAPILVEGQNEILVFEEQKGAGLVSLELHPELV